MEETKYINFKLNDPHNHHKCVSVAGSFNNWSSTHDPMEFDVDSKNWILDVSVDLPVNHKVVYKYVVDQHKWICDSTAPLETDNHGNENNVTYVISKSSSTNNSHNINSNNNNDDNDNIDNTKQQNEEIDHHSFHENDLFDAKENNNAGNIDADELTAPTSGEENNANEIDITSKPHENSQAIEQVDNKNNYNSNIPKPSGKFTFHSIWESITWFFKYYILSWFYPEN